MTAAKDWQSGKILQDRLHHMLTNELMCDVTFLVGPERTPIRAHKFMLSSASPVFYAMFDGPLAEQGDITIPDIEVNAFKDMLKFIYTDKVEVNATNVQGLVYGSDKYIIELLKEKCTSFLATGVNDENACIVLQTAYDFHLDTLRDEALKFILINGKSCLSSKTFLSLSQECVKLIIESDGLNCTEELVYEKMVEWSANRCQEQVQDITDENIRINLGDLLYLIRFPVIDQKYFTLNISKRGILTLQEIVEVYQSYHDHNSKLFDTKRRQFDKAAIQIFRCEVWANDRWSHSGLTDSLDLTTNFNAFLVGIYVFGSKIYSGKHDIKVDLVQSNDILGSVITEMYSVFGHTMYPIRFTSPIRINKDTQYSIQLTMKGPDVFSGHNYKSILSLENGRRVTFNDSILPSPNLTCASNGQIPGILLYSI